MGDFGVFFRRFLCGILPLFVIVLPVSAAPALSAESAVLMDADSGQILFAKDSDTRRGMASTTKIMTALLAIESGDMDAAVSIPKEAVGVEGSSLYLTGAERLTLRELVYGLLLQSANDAAVAIAVHIGGTLDGFVEKMNEKAAALELTGTHFQNPHGLADDAHYTTAKDLAHLTAYALQNPDFRAICSSLKAKVGERTVVNHNKLLVRYDGAIGVKTGFTKCTGRCLVSAAEREGVTLIAVTLSAPDDWNDHTALLDYGFSLLQSETLIEKGNAFCSLPILGGDTTEIQLTAEKTLTVTLPKAHGSIVVKPEIPRWRFAPVYAGDTLGRLRFFCDGKELGTVELLADRYIGKSTE